MITVWTTSDKIKNDIYIPKYYNPEITEEIKKLSKTHECILIKKLIDEEVISCSTGDEIGKGAYGTGDIPFVRTSDISNWEIKSIPKQGVSREIYDNYAARQDVRPGDILFVRDGTYLIGNSCFITEIDKELLYQSHILKIRVNKKEILEPEILFLLLNSSIVQKQIRAFQFTADIIDTIGQRFNEIIIPIPKDKDLIRDLVVLTRNALTVRVKGKAFIKNCSKIIEQVLLQNSEKPINAFLSMSLKEMTAELGSETITSEFGGFEYAWISSSQIIDNIFLPKYYDLSINKEIKRLSKTCELYSMKQLVEDKIIEYYTGDEIGKMAYGTGDIPFIRTSDFANWEIKHNPKQGISIEIYNQYKDKEDVRENDIFLVRDGTYLIGTTCLVTKFDEKCLFCGGLYKIRVLDESFLDSFLMLGLLNSYIVKRQIRTKQFTRDVIDTLGKRLEEVIIPFPKKKEIREAISRTVREVIESRISNRDKISSLVSLVLTQKGKES